MIIRHIPSGKIYSQVLDMEDGYYAVRDDEGVSPKFCELCKRRNVGLDIKCIAPEFKKSDCIVVEP